MNVQRQRLRSLGWCVVILLLSSSCGVSDTVKREPDMPCCERRCLEETMRELRKAGTPVAHMDASQELSRCADEALVLKEHERLGGESYRREFFRAMLALYKGRFAESGGLVSDLLQSADGEQWGLVGMAELALQTGNMRDLKLAVDLLESRSMTSGPNASRWDAFQYKIDLLMEFGEYDEVTKLLGQETSSSDESTSLLMTHTRILLLLRSGRYRDMDKLLRTLDESPGDDRNAMLLRANIIRIMGGPQKELAFLELARGSYPSDKYILHHYALALIESGDHEKGLPLLRRCAAAMPFDINVLADYLENEQSPPEARTALDRLEAIEVSVPRIHLMRAWRAYEAGDRAEMMSHLDAIEAIHPFHVGYLWFLYEALSKEEAYDQAGGVLRRLSRVDPHGVDVLAERVRMEARLGHLEAARQLLEGLKKSERHKNDSVLRELEVLVATEPPRQSSD